MIRAIVFDFGGVLMRTAEPAARREWETRLGLPHGELERVVHCSDVWIEAQRGALTPDEYWDAVGQRLGLGADDLAALQTDYFRDDQLDADLLALIRKLRGKGYRVGLLSNDASTLEPKLRQLGIYDLFDSVIISAQIGVMKPDAAAFRAVAKALGVSTPECAFIDDNTANVDGARAVGMKAILYRVGLDVAAALDPLVNDESQRTQAVIFDYGNVLDIPEDWAVWRAQTERLAEQFGMTGDALWSLIYQSEPWQRVKVGQITYEEYRDAICRPLGLQDAAAQEGLMRAFFKGREGVHPQMMALLRELRPRLRLALLSNAHQRDVPGWMAKVGLDGMFEVAISSAVVGVAKPDIEIYRLTLEQLGLEPGQALFVDDLVRNTYAAESIGLPCIVFESPEQTRHELQARGLL